MTLQTYTIRVFIGLLLQTIIMSALLAHRCMFDTGAERSVTQPSSDKDYRHFFNFNLPFKFKSDCKIFRSVIQ